ncbi:MAG TPA: peptidogalycan biosysnthesis protein, partial [Rhizomicrobium sp.]|nr:peptidogalycan biosysnthesis protein [Rhizomicrobium sp.]
MTSKNAARLIGSTAEIGAARWNALANPQGLAEPHPFTTYEFFAALEESGSAAAKSGWQPAHLLMDDGLMHLYLKSHSYGEYVFDQAWADALERAGGDYYPKLQCAVPFTPVTGRRLL